MYIFIAVFELHSSQDQGVRVHFTSTGDKVYGLIPEGKGQELMLSFLVHCVMM